MQMIDPRTLREKYPDFIYDSYSWKIEGEVFSAEWKFFSGDHEYSPDIRINLGFQPTQRDQNSLDNLVFHLGLSEIFSYWKATISPKIIIKAGFLSPDQLKWWEKLHLHGMGQFFYENKLEDFEGSFHWIVDSNKQHHPVSPNSSESSSLVLLGGGKDSIVTSELLTKSNIELAGFSLNPTPAVSRLASALPLKKLITAIRVIDPELIKLNSQGYLNGHVPFSAYLAFTSILVAYLGGFKNVIVSNEASSEEGNIEYQGMTINHQYSKTLEFEQDFRDYMGHYLTPKISYFSFLRPLYELQISRIFARYPKHYSDFRSCNIGQKSDSWCGNCPKCLSIYILLAPFITTPQLYSIFGTNLLDNPDLLPILKDMVEEGKTRPFECIGTREETIVALSILLKNNQKNPPILLKYFQDSILPTYDSKISELTTSILTNFGSHNLPPEYLKILRESLPRTLILGFGREGISSLKFLLSQNIEPSQITIYDEQELSNLPAESVELLKKYRDINLELGKSITELNLDIYHQIIKSPGIPDRLIPDSLKSKLTSPTQIFFDKCPGTIIGVTGTKGKSTTSTLISELCQSSGKKTVLLGNIGTPPLEYLTKIDSETYVVYELSSHQLSGLTRSPHIAVLLGIFPEHLDYYHNMEEYLEAKAHITRFQTANDYLVYDDQNLLSKQIAASSSASLLPVTRGDVDTAKSLLSNSRLLGDMNAINAAAAIKVASILGITEPTIKEVLTSFKPLPYRLEHIGTFKGIAFVNDSLSTVPQATIAALSTLGNNVATIILGGSNRNVSFSDLAKDIVSRNYLRNIIFFPTTGKQIWEEISSILPNAKTRFTTLFAQTMEEAVRHAYKYTGPGNICLLSPGAPSFSTFKDYRDRGDQFRDQVQKLST